jgi:hypothetical protein
MMIHFSGVLIGKKGERERGKEKTDKFYLLRREKKRARRRRNEFMSFSFSIVCAGD